MPGQLAAKVRAKFPGVYDDMDDASLEKAVLAKHPEYADLVEPAQTDPRKPASAETAAQPSGDLGRFAGYKRIGDAVMGAIPSAVNALPAIGGAFGGMAAGIPGAAIGGAAGQGYRTLMQHATELPGAVRDVARNMLERPIETAQGMNAGINRGGIDTGVQAVAQAGLQKGGDLLAAGASKAGSYLMGRAANASTRLSREFPSLPQTLIEHSLTVSKGGLNEARTLLRAAKDEANMALQTAQASGATVPVSAATAGLDDTLRKVMDSADIEGGLRTLAAVERKLLGGRGAALTPIQADALKRSLQLESKALYTAQKMGTGRPNASIRAEAIADMARTLNDGIAAVVGPGYKAANAEAKQLIGATRGLEQAVVRSGRPATTLYQAGMNLATSPANTSRLAIVLSKPSVQAMLKQSPRLAAALAELASSSNQEPE